MCNELYHWWLVEVPYWFKVSFFPNVLEIFVTRDDKDNFTRGTIEPAQGEIKANESPKWFYTPWYFHSWDILLEYRQLDNDITV